MFGVLATQKGKNRVYGLDILRAFAILFVVLVHGKSYLPQEVQALHKYVQMDGVSIFFVLSGFLIGGILIKLFETKEINWNLMFNFWIRRWFRTLPNYFLVLIAIIVMKSYYKDILSILDYFVFAQNLWYPHPKFFPEAWSLSVEEWFYLTIPLFAFVLMKVFKIRPKPTILVTALIVLISVTAFRYFRWSTVEMASYKDFDPLFRQQVITRLDSLMYGIIGAFLMYYYRELWFRYKNLLLFLGLAVIVGLKIADLNGMMPVRQMFNCVFSFSVFSLGILLMLPYLSDLKKGKGALFRFVTLTSLISYSMYLVNYTVIKFQILKKIPFNDFLGNNLGSQLLQYALFWILTYVISALIFRYFEIPMMNFRDHPKVKNRFPLTPKNQG